MYVLFLLSFSFQFPQSFDTHLHESYICSWRVGGGAEDIFFSAATTAARARRRECQKQRAFLLPTRFGARLAVVLVGCVAA